MRHTCSVAIVASTLMVPPLQCAAQSSPAADAKVVAEATHGRLQSLGGSYFDKDFEASVEYQAEVIDLNGDGQPEVFTKLYGGMFGMAGVNMDLLIKGKDGQWKSQFGFPGEYRILKTKSLGFPDIEIGGPGTCFPVWRWNGSSYAIFRRCPQ